jgi:arylformamidase
MLDYEAEYNNRRRVPESLEIAARWAAASAAYAKAAHAEFDQPYGSGERQKYDLFHARDRCAGLIVYIHGGYWQRGDRKEYAFVAETFNRLGIDVAIPSYTLCPAARITDIVAELRLCLAALWHKTRAHPLVIGHSAGGHLTAAMLATDWNRIAGVPATLVAAGCAISGLFELAPLVNTSINDAVGLDTASAWEASPLLWPPPPKDRSLLAAVGELESSEFHRQSRAIVGSWATAGLATEFLSVPDANHFTILNALMDPESALFKRAVALAGRSASCAATP